MESAPGSRRRAPVVGAVAAVAAVVSLAATVATVAVDVRTAGTRVPASAGLSNTWLDVIPGLSLVIPASWCSAGFRGIRSRGSYC
jgi:hypothetical protein